MAGASDKEGVVWERFDSVTRELWGVARHIPKAVYDWCLGRCVCSCLWVFGDTKRERGFGYEAFLVLDDLPSSFSGYRVFKQSRSVSAIAVTHIRSLPLLLLVPFSFSPQWPLFAESSPLFPPRPPRIPILTPRPSLLLPFLVLTTLTITSLHQLPQR